MSFKKIVQAVASATLALASNFTAAQENQLNMARGVTELGSEIYDLHMLILWICVVIGLVVFGVMFYSIIFHRKSKGYKPANFHESTKVEIAWTVVPFLILIGMAVPATSTLLEVYNSDDAEIDILVTGYQWKWKYEYLDEDGENISFFSNLSTPQSEIYNTQEKNPNYLLEVDEPVVIPVNTKVRFLLTANDVIHSWWMPELGVKKDAIPGFINEAWTIVPQEGVYRGQCTELCGAYHGFMPVVVHAVSQAEYDEWLSAKRADAEAQVAMASMDLSLDDLMSKGESIYSGQCVACHGANGEGGVGKPIAGSAIVLGDLTKHLGVTTKGVPGTAMQAFGSQLSDVDIAAVVTYQRNAFGNNTGDIVQPSDVVSYKNG
ncbi:cytochrome-c oxidase, subunit II [Luminiphilus syltensis NOR5-1B]|uniref:Cytochrome c oxidase subunit 2 n=1 Tax=Luminiphilus syltensis NOR5-1B TaxID=565045 RepID=B8KUG9_9GAMM|nr:cytochrome c oxidase subunit II [Luminiphilus syltensis]EED36098.1 cytochrome-c oxidase, subunit II [Luminiphilus syltensis NOR5-1B]